MIETNDYCLFKCVSLLGFVCFCGHPYGFVTDRRALHWTSNQVAWKSNGNPGCAQTTNESLHLNSFVGFFTQAWTVWGEHLTIKLVFIFFKQFYWINKFAQKIIKRTIWERLLSHFIKAKVNRWIRNVLELYIAEPIVWLLLKQ
jgi:hypothetical protein